jgi:membrane dipeptidase
MDVSDHARALSRDCELIDLHLDCFIPWRLFGYDPLRRHGRGILRGRFFGHTDLPRAQDGGLSAGMWCLTTNPFRTARGRWGAFQRNLDGVRALLTRAEGKLAFARDRAEYDAVRATGAHAVLLAVQGGNAFDAAPEGPASTPDRLLTRVTLVHLTNAWAGATSAPFGLLRPHKGLTDHGRRMVAQCDAARIFVDLAHIHPKGFWDAVEAHDATLPLIVTHTGVDGVKRHWRNLDDRQIRAVTDTGGVVGVMFHSGYLRRRGGPRDGAAVVEHMEHIIQVGGEQAVALGTDFDGFILPPGDLRYGDSYPRLVQHMLNRGWSEARIRGALGENFLRSWARLRPGG